uniref:ferroxidase n=1 Tax=Anser brachyrhynchus TaxID=132585 RepID=A0A8B9BIK1_9AVES
MTIHLAAMESQVHQNCHHECKATVNGAAITELHAAYVCLFIALHFKGDDVAVPHLRCFFQERVHMLLLNVKKPECDTWGSALEAVEAVLQLQRSVNQAAAAEPPGHTEKGGPHLCDFLESHYMDEQPYLLACRRRKVSLMDLCEKNPCVCENTTYQMAL